MPSGPLDGVRVVDLTAIVMGPYCTQIMADMGADVVKIEPPAGDNARYISVGPAPGMSGVFVNVNRGKRSVVLDLTTAEGKAALRALIAKADVFIHSMRGRAIAKLGFAYDDVVADIVARTTALAEAAVAAGVDRERVLVDPGHDFGKNTRHSLLATRRLDELAATGWPVLVALSNKDFVGETLDVPLEQRLTGTLAATAVSAWLGARVFRAHDVAVTRQTLDMVAAIRGDRQPARSVRGLA